MPFQLGDITKQASLNANTILSKQLDRLQNDYTKGDDAALLTRATFLSNIFCGSKNMSSFELVRGYTPALLGIHSEIISTKLLEGHKVQSIRAITKILPSETSHLVTPYYLPSRTEIYFSFETSKQNLPIEKVPGKVYSLHPFYVKIIPDKGRKTNL